MNNREQKKMENGKKQYIVTLVITLAAMALIVAYTFGSSYTLAKEDALLIGRKTIAEQSERLNNFLLKGMDVLQVTALTVDYMLQNGADSEEIEDYLRHGSVDYARRIDENFTGIYGVFDGEYIDGIGWVPEKDYVPQSRPWYLAAAENAGKPAAVSPYVDAQTGKVMISVSQLLSDGESAVSLDIYMDEMQEYVRTIRMNGRGYGFIMDARGLVVAHSDERQTGRNYLTDTDIQSSEMNLLAKQIINGSSDIVELKIGEEDCIAFSQVVQESWYVVLIVKQDDLFQRVERILLRNTILALTIYGIIAYFCADSYRNRVKAMQYAAELKDYQQTLEDRVREQTEEIRQQSEKILRLQENVVEGMAILIESRDGNTGEHVRHTKRYVSMIAEYMYEHNIHSEEVTRKFIKRAESGAVLHDIGKIQISDVILNKPGKFKPEEYELMKKHTEFGGKIVKDILGKEATKELVQVASNIARYHHEKWDGSGYPEGLKATEIPLCARIMAVADVFDAIISKRVYKEDMSIDEAFHILKLGAGTHFDPEIVEIFTALRPEVERYLKESDG